MTSDLWWLIWEQLKESLCAHFSTGWHGYILPNSTFPLLNFHQQRSSSSYDLKKLWVMNLSYIQLCWKRCWFIKCYFAITTISQADLNTARQDSPGRKVQVNSHLYSRISAWKSSADRKVKGGLKAIPKEEEQETGESSVTGQTAKTRSGVWSGACDSVDPNGR